MSFRSGIYRWIYKNGQFEVAFRPHGIFQCSKYPGEATWELTGDLLVIKWKSYGIYEFPNVNVALPRLEGFAQGSTSNWRQLEFLRDFTPAERILLGEGYGSVWSFIYEKGSFEIEFRTDSYSHFVCSQYPAHSHWSVDGSGLVSINWGKYGEYELQWNEGSRELVGHKKDQPSNWRKATLIRNLGPEAMNSLPAHEHSHEHDANCSH